MIRPIRLAILAPGHFHAALVQKRMPPGVHHRAFVYAPLDGDLLSYMAHVRGFNGRADDPTLWELDIRAGDNYLARFLREPAGNVAVVAGRNKPKADRILAAVGTGRHVLADKPWVIDADDFPKLEAILRAADEQEVIAWDMMTERFEPATALLRELMRDPAVFGTPLAGTADEPGLTLESVHHLRKTVAGRPLVRPAWWFDPAEAGHALADVGTHLADLAMWLLFPDQPIDYRRDLDVHDAACWPTPLAPNQFAAVTGLRAVPAELKARHPAGDPLLYCGNGSVGYRLRGVNVRLTARWEYEPADPGGGDTFEAVARGTKARVTVRPAAAPGGGVRAELFAAATAPAGHPALLAAVRRRCADWQATYPGVVAADLGTEVRVKIPDAFRGGHEDRFAAVVREFAGYFYRPREVPPWERPNLLAKYYLTTKATRMAMEARGEAGRGDTGSS